MIYFHIAVEIARKYYAEKGQQELTKVYDQKRFGLYMPERKTSLNSAMLVLPLIKKQAKISRFILPSRTNFEILNNKYSLIFNRR